MRKLYKYFLLALILGCSSDDNDVSKTQLKTEHFNITVSEITESSAQISWNITEIGIAEGVSENNLLFDIYLNDSLVIENISQNGYTLENLDFDKEYSYTLIVKEDSNNQVEIPFGFITNVTPLKIEHFNITISETTVSSVQISWNITEIGIAEGVSENNLLYDIYLDDSLVIENISENGYMLENLDFNTEYSCKLIVKQSSNNQVEIPFVFTTDVIQLRIEHFNISVSEITENSAQISWNITQIGITEGISEYNLLYDIYLDDSLVIENISQNEYTLENLDFDTEYSCKLTVKQSSNNQVEIPFVFETILDYSNYYPLEVGNIWYYDLKNIAPFQQDAWQITERIISTEIFDNKVNFFIEQNKLWSYHYSNGTQSSPCTTTTTHFYLRFEDDILIKRNISSQESIVIDFNEIPSGSVSITEECDVPFYSITSCIYRRAQEFGGYGVIYKYMHHIGKTIRYSGDGIATSTLDLIGFKQVNSVLIGNEHNIVCD